MNLKIKKLHPAAIVPTYASEGAACFDLHSIGGPLSAHGLHPGDKATFRTGLSFEVPPGWVMMIYSRSGHGFKNDVRLANCVGVIDSDYRGEVLVKLTSDQHVRPNILGTLPFAAAAMAIQPGDRIAQAMLVPVERVTFTMADELSNTARGAGGFGSTGT